MRYLKVIWEMFKACETTTKLFIYFILASVNVIVTPIIAEIMNNKYGEIASIISLIIYCVFGGSVLYELLKDDIEEFIVKVRLEANLCKFDKKCRIGIFASGIEERDECLKFCNGLIFGRNESVKNKKIYNDGFEITTDKNVYKFLLACYNSKGVRLKESHVMNSVMFLDNSSDILDIIWCCTIPNGGKDSVHIMSKY